MAEHDAAGEPVERGEGAEGFPHGSKYPLFVGAGLFFIGLGLAWVPLALIVGVPIELYGLWGWAKEYTIEEFEAGVIPEQKRQVLGFETGLLGMFLFVVSEILVFAGFFVAWFYLDATRGPFPPPGYPALTQWLGALMTGLLLIGSLAVWYGRTGIVNDGDRGRLVTGYGIAILTGIAFLVALGYEWSQLLAEGLRWTTGPYGASYYALAALHAGHLVAGLVMLGIVIYRARARNHFSERRNLMVRTVEVYWHFLTAVSMAIFVFVYFGMG